MFLFRDNPDHEVLIESTGRWKRLVDLRDIYEYRDLLRIMIYRAIRARYAQSALGLSWAVIQPFFTMIVFTIIFGRLVRVDSDGAPYALFSFAALVPWTYFQESLTDSVSCLIVEQNTITKSYFPRIILPASRILARFVDFLIAGLLLAGMLVWYGMPPTPGIFVLPVLVLILMLAAAGTGFLFGAMAVQYRDINYAMAFVTRLLMYSAPVVYPASMVPEKLLPYYSLNPMVGVVEGFRSALLATRPMPWDLILPGAVTAALLFIFGTVYFRNKERIFADVA